MPSATFFNLPPAKREKLLAAARAEFVRAPFAQASVNRIIHGAGIPRGSFYMYFADKEELFRYLMEDFGTQLIRQMERLLEERNGAVFSQKEPATTTTNKAIRAGKRHLYRRKSILVNSFIPMLFILRQR